MLYITAVTLSVFLLCSTSVCLPLPLPLSSCLCCSCGADCGAAAAAAANRGGGVFRTVFPPEDYSSEQQPSFSCMPRASHTQSASTDYLPMNDTIMKYGRLCLFHRTHFWRQSQWHQWNSSRGMCDIADGLTEMPNLSHLDHQMFVCVPALILDLFVRPHRGAYFCPAINV